jgi:hypothetical protein
MSYKVPVNANRLQFDRQQEKLRIARQALARVEANYARKRHVKHPTDLPRRRERNHLAPSDDRRNQGR